MSRKETRILSEDLLSGDSEKGDWLITSIFYQKGGLSWVTYKEESRGYYLSVRRVHRERSSGGFMMESFMMFTGGMKRFLEPAKMFGAKHLASIVVADAVVANLKAAVLASTVKDEVLV